MNGEKKEIILTRSLLNFKFAIVIAHILIREYPEKPRRYAAFFFIWRSVGLSLLRYFAIVVALLSQVKKSGSNPHHNAIFWHFPKTLIHCRLYRQCSDSNRYACRVAFTYVSASVIAVAPRGKEPSRVNFCRREENPRWIDFSLAFKFRLKIFLCCWSMAELLTKKAFFLICGKNNLTNLIAIKISP